MALTKVGSGGIENVTNSANATFLTIDASEQITVASEGGAVTTSVQQGLAKAWACIDGTGTINLRDSLNTASVTDNGTGDYTATYSSAMNNDDYAHPLGTAVGSDFVFSRATTNIRIKPFSVSGSQVDTDPVTFAILGDLA